MTTNKIGLFGGTFDPVHKGHVKIAKIVRKKLSLDRVIFIPAGVLPHKAKSFASASERLKMVRLALDKEEGLEVSDYEVKKITPSYTIDTVKYWKRQLVQDSQLFFIVGADAFREISTWKQWKKLSKFCQFVVVNRRGYGELNVPEIFTGKFLLIKIPQINISATAIRKSLSKGLPVGRLLAPQVYRYIKQKKLYGKSYGKSAENQ